ncbi:MAG: diacylglycerol kinase family lipid kinase [Prevotellaceae bacterium]|nr:diacylglycerol kinase family lipid kinase [Prevotellaceae bacterium]
MKSIKKIVFIINPRSGRSSKNGLPKLIDKILDKEIFDYEILYTEFAGHATQLAAEAVSNKADIVVAVGGDGTINEIGRALIGTDTALGIIPCGSGNGLARHLEIPLSHQKALKIINKCEIHKLDYGRINGIPFFCTCGMGFDAVISKQFAKVSKRGPSAYIDSILKEIVNYKPETYTIEIPAAATSEGESASQYKAFLITCGNASQWGNNAYIAPHASMSDGLMDVIILEPFLAIEVPELSLQLFSKSIDRNSRIKSFRSNKIIIHREKAGAIHFDGDPMESDKDVVIEMVKQGIKVVVNPEHTQGSQREKTLMDAYSDLMNSVYDVRDDLAKILNLNNLLSVKIVVA